MEGGRDRLLDGAGGDVFDGGCGKVFDGGGGLLDGGWILGGRGTDGGPFTGGGGPPFTGGLGEPPLAAIGGGGGEYGLGVIGVNPFLGCD